MSESIIDLTCEQVPRHYVLRLVAAVSPLDMIDLMVALDELDDEGKLGTFLAALRDACKEAYTGDLPQALGLPVPVPDETESDEESDEDEGAGGATVTGKK
jgi:hypothetical protein